MKKILALVLAFSITAPLLASAAPTQSVAQKVSDTYHTQFQNAGGN